MAIYQGDIGIHDIKLGSIDVFEIYQGSKLVYPENTEITITFKLNVSGTVTINGYTPIISENNTKFVFTIPVKTDYTANITAEHYKSQTISGNSGYLSITHNVELEWEQRFISYTVTFPTDGVKVLFDGIEKGVITNGKLVVLIDDTEAKDSYTVTFKGSKASIYDTSTLTVVDSSIANIGGVYDLKLPTSSVKTRYKRTDYASSTGSITKGSTYAGTWIETVVSLTASFTSSTTLGSISNNVLTIPNNESTNTKSGTLTVIFTLENKQTKEVSAALNQAAGAKVYTNWVLDLQTDGTSVEAKGGTRTITANVARRTYKWNNTGTVYSETATPTLSISGSASGFTLSGKIVTASNNTTTNSRSITITATYSGVSKSINITQSAGAKTNITSSTKVLFLYEGASNYVEAINNSVYINNARDNNGNNNGAVSYDIRFKVIITESYKWNNTGNTISSESYGSINRHKDISFNTSTFLHKDTDNSYYGSFSIVSKNTADEEEYSAQYITNNNIIITLYVRRPRLYWQIWCNAILEQKDQPFIVNVNNVTRTRLYNNNTITEGCAGSGEQYLYLCSTSNMMTSRSITVKLIRNNNPNDACKLIGFTDINTDIKTSVGLEEDKTVIRTFVTSYIQTLPINLCKVTFEYAELKFRVFIAKDIGN